MNTEHITIGEAVRRLRANYPDVVFEGGELAEGFWLSASSGTWAWERFRMASALSALASARLIVDSFAALAHGS